MCYNLLCHFPSGGNMNCLQSSFLMGFPGGSDGKESACNTGDLGLTPSVGMIPYKRAWQPTLVFFPGESPWTEKPGGL